MISRRDFLGTASVLGAAALSGVCSIAAAAEARVPGIQLYTVRKSMATDVAGTLRAIAEIGYREVEFAGYGGQPPDRIRALLDEFGLRAPSSHMSSRELRRDPRPLIELAASNGHRYVTIGGLAEGDRRMIDDFRRWAEVFNRLGEACRDHGMRFAYHNHGFEFVSLDGHLPYDVLLNETDANLVDFQLDFFWVRKAGHDILSVLRQAPERFSMAHIKDMDADGNIVDVGAGEIDFATILADPAAACLKHLFVEHDNPDDAFKSAAISYRALNRILL